MHRRIAVIAATAASLILLASAAPACAPPLRAPVAPGVRFAPRRLLVKFRAGADPERVEAARVRVGAQTWERLPLGGADVLHLDGSVDIADALQRLGNFADVVEYAEPDVYYELQDAPPPPTDYDGNLLWSLAAIEAPEAWQVTEGARSAVVAVLDSGVDGAHADLSANLWRNERESLDGGDDDGDGYVDDVHGWDFVRGRPDVVDEIGHGTAIAGIAGAVGGNGGIVGVAPRVSLMSLAVVEPPGEDAAPGAATSNVVRALDYARAHGARVVNASWGSPAFSETLFEAAREAGDAGMLIVAAAGNGPPGGRGFDLDEEPFYPAAFRLPNVVAVAASDLFDRVAPFSGSGDETVALAAPGVDVLSTAPGGGYARVTGTSVAAAHVSGVAALVLSRWPELPARELAMAIVDSAQPEPWLDGRVTSGGRLNAASALTTADDLVLFGL